MTPNHRTYAEVLQAPPPLLNSNLPCDKAQDEHPCLWQPTPRLQAAMPELDGKTSMLLPEQGDQLDPEVHSSLESLTQLEDRCVSLMKQESRMACPHAIERPAETLPWPDYIELHQALLYGYQDIILVSLSPNAAYDVRAITFEHQLPRRMWSSGMQPLLSVLHSWSGYQDTDQACKFREHMRTFILIAYALVASLYETAPVFKGAWAAYLGHLSQYRAGAEEDVGMQEHWQAVANYWYSQLFTLDMPPGEVYYHYSSVPGLDSTKRLLHLAQSVMSARPPPASQHALVRALSNASITSGLSRVDYSFLDLHWILAEASFRRTQHQKSAETPATTFKWISIYASSLLSSTRQIGQFLPMFAKASFQINKDASTQLACNAIIDIAGWFEYGADSAALGYAFNPQQDQGCVDLQGALAPSSPLTPSIGEFRELSLIPESTEAILDSLRLNPLFQRNLQLTMGMLSTILAQTEPCVDVYMHIMASFFDAIAAIHCISCLIDGVPWVAFAKYLNNKTEYAEKSLTQIEIQRSIVKPVFHNEQDLKLLPEDLMMRGLLWTKQYFPENWFDQDEVEEDPQNITERRNLRLLRLGFKLSQVKLAFIQKYPLLTRLVQSLDIIRCYSVSFPWD
jgi:hypothetical protein